MSRFVDDVKEWRGKLPPGKHIKYNVDMYMREENSKKHRLCMFADNDDA